MRLPRLQGRIERRLLVNYRVDPEAIARLLPQPFRPQLVRDHAVAGICLIRLGQMRPQRAPGWTGMRSENAAHRIAVEWDAVDGPRTGVYIPRRDSDSLINVVLGGRVYPGEHHRARFDVDETDENVSVGFESVDRSARVEVAVRVTDRLTCSHLFADTEAASEFFRAGSAGYSATRNADRLDGLKLQTSAWRIEPTAVTGSHSSFFEDRSNFPVGTAELDCALIMRHVPVIWEPLDDLKTAAGIAS